MNEEVKDQGGTVEELLPSVSCCQLSKCQNPTASSARAISLMCNVFLESSGYCSVCRNVFSRRPIFNTNRAALFGL